MKPVSALRNAVLARTEFQRDAPEQKTLVSKRSILRLGRIIDCDEARVLKQAKETSEIFKRKILHAVNTSTRRNVSFSLSGSNPKQWSLVSVVEDESSVISFAVLLGRELNSLNRLSLRSFQTVDA